MTPAPAERLATLRVLVGGFAVGYLVVRLPHFWSIMDLDARRWDPVGLYAGLDAPLPAALSRAFLVLAIVTGLAFVAGWRYRVLGPCFAVLLLVVMTGRNSWGQVWHTENLLCWHALILACAPAAAVLSVDAKRAPARPSPGEQYAWPIMLMSVVTVATYVLAGVTKLREGGIDWITGEALHNHVAFDNVRKAALGADSSPFAGPVLRHAWIFRPFAWAALAVELGAPVAFLGRRWRNVWVAAAWSFHVGIAALMAIGFPYQLLGVAYASFFPVERIRQRLAEGRPRLARARLRT